MPKNQATDRDLADGFAGQALRRVALSLSGDAYHLRRVGIVVACDPEPVAARHHRRQLGTKNVGHVCGALAVVKTVTKADHHLRIIVGNNGRKPDQRCRGVIWRNERAPSGIGCALFEMKVGHGKQIEVVATQRDNAGNFNLQVQ